jgi:hypothetical protein
MDFLTITGPHLPTSSELDIVEPHEGEFYGFVGGLRGWYLVPYSSLTGIPSNIGSSVGSESISGTSTLTLVNDVATPVNGQFYGFAGNQRGWFTPAVNTIASFDSGDGNPPASNYAYFATRNNGGLSVLRFAASVADTSIIFTDIIPQGVTFSTGVQIVIWWASVTAVTGAVEFSAALDNASTHSIDIDAYGVASSTVTTVRNVAAVPNSTVISLPYANMQNLTAEQPYKLRITRRVSDTVNDTLADFADVWLVEMRVF